MKLDFIIIGGQKCGSTYLQSVINHHPQAEMVENECPHFESPDFENGGLEKLQREIERLPQSKVLGIKRPNYLGKPEVPERIYSVNPKIKLIVILRNPVERFKSAYFHQMRNGVGPILPLNKGTEGILTGQFENRYPKTTDVLEFGLYSKYLKKYVELFGDNLLILIFDELRQNKLAVINKCYKFLDIDESYIPYNVLNSRPQKVTYSLSSAKLMALRNKFKFHYTTDHSRLSPKKQSIIDKLFVSGIEKLNHTVFSTLALNKAKPEFSPKLRNTLINLYTPDIKELEILTKRDLSSWMR